LKQMTINREWIKGKQNSEIYARHTRGCQFRLGSQGYGRELSRRELIVDIQNGRICEAGGKRR
jgi:hypothetical protein